MLRELLEHIDWQNIDKGVELRNTKDLARAYEVVAHRPEHHKRGWMHEPDKALRMQDATLAEIRGKLIREQRASSAA